jgi:hypothetical protein
MNRLTRYINRPRWMWAVSIAIALLVAILGHYHPTLFASPDGVAQANVFLTTDWLIMESLDYLLNKLGIGNHFNTDDNDQFEQEFAVGATVRKKFPWRPTVTRGLGYAPQPIQRIATTISVDQIVQSSFEWDSYEKAVNMERGEAQLKKEYIHPCMDYMAQEIENICALWAKNNLSNIVGQLGTDPTDFDTSTAAARQKLAELACPPGGERGVFLPPSVSRALKKSGLGYLNPVKDVSKAFRVGLYGEADGFDLYESVSLYSHTAGTWAGAVTVNGAGQSGSSITITATAGDTFKQGDKISFANVNPVNPMTRRRVGASAKTFSVTQDLTAAGGGVDVLNITPAIFGPTSNYQNVDALPATGAALTLFPGTTSPNGKTGTVGLALHRNAFALASLPLEVPKAAEPGTGHMRDEETGIEIAFVRMFDPVQRKMINRFDMVLGNGNLYNDNCGVAILCA